MTWQHKWNYNCKTTVQSTGYRAFTFTARSNAADTYTHNVTMWCQASQYLFHSLSGGEGNKQVKSNQMSKLNNYKFHQLLQLQRNSKKMRLKLFLTWLFFVGMVVLRLMSLVNTPPSVSMPNERGVTSRSSTSVTSPASTPACRPYRPSLPSKHYQN